MGTLSAPDTSRLRECADRVADLLLENAIIAGGRSTWLGVALDSLRDGANIIYRTGDPTLYDGTAGIALSCWTAAAALERDDLAEVAVAAARHAISARDRRDGTGLFDGLAGVGLAALEVGDCAGDARLRAQGMESLGQAADALTSDVDLIRGSAGIVLALLHAARVTASDRWRTAAVRHGEHLLAVANRHPWGWGWTLTGFGGPDLCGLAHGAAGIAWALGALAAATGDDRFQEAVDGARRYERSWFQPVANSWPDLRPETSPAGSPLVCPALWCHGAAGIGLSRLALFSLTHHPSLAAEAAAALQAVTNAASSALNGNIDGGLTLCHGLGGTLLLLLSAHHALDEPEHLAAARWLANRALDRLGEDPVRWPSGIPSGGFSPGLMTGLAGALYVLVRVADPSATRALTVLGDQG